MIKEVREKLREAKNHIENYMDDADATSELRKMCKRCEQYCGKEHDYSECSNMWCYKFWLAYIYLEWESSYR